MTRTQPKIFKSTLRIALFSSRQVHLNLGSKDEMFYISAVFSCMSIVYRYIPPNHPSAGKTRLDPYQTRSAALPHRRGLPVVGDGYGDGGRTSR